MRHATSIDARVDSGSESGFTLVELLLVTVLLPLIVGSMTLAIIMALGIQSSVSAEIGGSGDAQVVSSVFYKDVQGALAITTSASAGQCGAGTQLLGLKWGLSAVGPPTYQYVVSYVVVQYGADYSIVRNYCASGISSTPTNSIAVVNNIRATPGAPVILPPSSDVSAEAGWMPAQLATSIAWSLIEPKSGYSYVLVATPAVSESSGSTN